MKLNVPNLKVIVLCRTFSCIRCLIYRCLYERLAEPSLRVQGEKMEVRIVSAVGAYVLMVVAWVYFVYRPYYIHKSIWTSS